MVERTARRVTLRADKLGSARLTGQLYVGRLLARSLCMEAFSRHIDYTPVVKNHSLT